MLKKTITLMLSALCCTALLTACGGSSNKSNTENNGEAPIVDVDLESTSINGKLGKAFDVVDKDYKTNSFGEISVTLKRNDSKPQVNFDDVTDSYSASSSTKPYIGEFTLELLDESGSKIADAEMSDPLETLMSMVEGDETSVKFVCYGDLSQAKSFRVVTTLKNNDKNKEALKSLEEDQEIEDAVEMVSKSAETAGKMLDAASSALDALNSLTK